MSHRAPLRLKTSFVALTSRSRWPLPALLLWPLLLFAGAGLESMSPALGGSIFLSGFVLAGVALAAVIRAQRPVLGDVVIDEEGVSLGSARIPRGILRGAYYAPGAGRIQASVKLQGEGDRALGEIVVSSEADADRVLEALGLGVDHSTARFSAVAPGNSLASYALLTLLVLGFGTFALAGLLHSGLVAALGVALAIAAPIAFVPATIHVGADGLRVEPRIGSRFVSWSEVVAIEPYARGVKVQLRGGELVLPMTSRFALHYDHERVAQAALLARAQAAMAAYRAGEIPDVAARVARRGRAIDDWIRELFDRAGDFREAPLQDEPLWAVVENPSSGASARAGAAAVLARTGGEAERTRLRIAAESCASPRLRVALDRFAEGADDEAMAEVLATIEDEEAEPKAHATS